MFNYRLIPYLSIIICSIIFTTPVISQFLQPSFKNYTVDDGLPSSEVYIAIQDNDGYMWFGTDNGLSRFDGYEFKNYGIPEGLTSLVIFDLKLDEKGRLWIMSMTGEIFIYDNKTIEPYEYNHLIQEYADDFIFAKNISLENGHLFICLELHGILSIDPLGNAKNVYNSKTIRELVVATNDNDDFLMNYNYINKDKYRIEANRNKILGSKESIPISIITSNYSTTIKINKLKGLGYSVTKLKNETFLIHLTGNTALIQKGKILWQRPDDRVINHLLYTSNEQFWVALHAKKGIQIYNNIQDLKSKKYSSILEGYSISKIFKDKSDGIWATSLDNGIFYCPSYQQSYHLESPGLSNKFVSGISASQNDLYIATRDLKFFRYNFLEKSIYTIPQIRGTDRLIPQAGYDITYSQINKKLLRGTLSAIWYNNKWKTLDDPFYKNPRSLVFKKIGSNEHNNNFLSHSATSAAQINIKDGILVTKTSHNVKWITSANYDALGNRWIGLDNGLWQWIGDSLVRPTNTPPELLNRIDAIEFDTENNFVIGTKGNGVIIWNKTSSPTIINTKDGLTSNIIENIFIDSLQQIWAGTLNGLNRIRINDKIQVKQFTKKHGLPGNEIVKVRRHKDHIWVATTTGLGRIEDEGVNTNTTVPLLNNFIVNGKSITITPNHQFSSSEKNISIEYVALDFKAQSDITYRYRLHSNSEWQTLKNTSINLPNLRPDNYEFEIQAQNEDGYWSDSLLINFSILQPIWKRWWFLLIAGLSILGISGWYIRKRQSQQLDELKKEHRIQSQITELERSALQAQMNPHFIFNILNSIQLAINENEKEMASQTLSKFAKLIRSTLKNAKTSRISIEEEIKYIESYLYLEQIRFKKEAFHYAVVSSKNLDLFDTEIPPMLVQPFVENAIKHGTRNNDKAEIHVSYDIEEGYVIVKVRDNGSGFKYNNQSTHDSLGMSITQRRLELLNQDDKFQNTFKIHQLKDTSNEIVGTEIEIFIKIS